MNDEEMLALAEKVKNGTATKDELNSFTDEYTKLLSYLNEEIKKEEGSK